MNKFLKSALVVAGVAGAFSVAEASAASFNLVIDKIEIVTDADSYPNTATTVYGPGGTASVDMFNATQKLGASFVLAKPGAGTYESMVISFSSIKAVSGTDEVDLLAGYRVDATNYGTNGSLGVMVLGDTGAGVALDNSLSTAFGINAGTGGTRFPMHSIIADGVTNIALPTLDFYLPEANVVANGSGISLTSYPAPFVTVSQATDSASRANVLVQVVDGTAFAASTGWALGASTVTVGLFDTSVPEVPLVTSTYTAASPTAVQVVEFIDVPNVAVYPLAWIDADSDGRLDAGEDYTFAETVRATNSITVSGTADISASNIIDITNAGADGKLDSVALVFPGRSISITVAMTNEASAVAVAGNCDTVNGLLEESAIVTTNGLAGIAATAMCTAATNSSVTIVYAMNSGNTISQSVELLTRLGAVTVGNTTIEATESTHPYLLNTTQFDTLGSVSYIGLAAVAHDDATRGRVLIVGVPAFDTDFAADLAGATYEAEVRASWQSDVAGPEVGAVLFDQGSHAVVGATNVAAVAIGALATITTLD